MILLEELQSKLEMMLGELRDQIIEFTETDRVDDAKFFLEQYIKLAPTTVERFSLEALISAGESDWDGAESILKNGIHEHPLSFDLLYNLGYVYQQKQEILEAYHIYMKAHYVAEEEQEKSDIGAALKGLVDDIQGRNVSDGSKIYTEIRAGEVVLTVSMERDELLRRKEILNHIEMHIGKDLSSVLEIGFNEGAISKNLNYYGYEVTAVDRIKERILHVIAREWHDNILHPEQKVAKFYQEPVDLDWLGKIPKFDVIIAVGGQNITAFNITEGETKAVLEALLEKASKQLFLVVSSSIHSINEFSKQELVEIADTKNLGLEVIASIDTIDGEQLELCVVNKELDFECFSVPSALSVPDSESTIFEVELTKCVDLYGAGYVTDWHPFVQVLKQHQEEINLKYEDSILREYYDKFKPKNLEEGLFAKRGRARKLERGWIGLPWFWDENKRVIFEDKLGETRPGGNHFFGPNTEEFGAAELGRLVHLLPVLEEQGYQPEFFSDGYISGYLLIKGNDYRFVVTEGQHRIACLAALGYESIRVRFSQKPEYPRIVRFEDVKRWPQVINGAYSVNLAFKVFERFFMDGVGKERMGLA